VGGGSIAGRKYKIIKGRMKEEGRTIPVERSRKFTNMHVIRINMLIHYLKLVINLCADFC